jgi:hypothetical protein
LPTARPRVREYAILPLADATAALPTTDLPYDSTVVAAFHGGLIGTAAADREIVAALRGDALARDGLLRALYVVVAAASSAWQVPSVEGAAPSSPATHRTAPAKGATLQSSLPGHPVASRVYTQIDGGQGVSPHSMEVGNVHGVSLHTADDISLAAEWRFCPGASAVVAVVHGFSASKHHPAVVELASDLQRSYHVLTYDARGDGASGGQSSLGSREHHDVAAVAAEAGRRGLPVVLLGISMGAVAVTCHLADTPHPPNGIAGAVLISGPAR